MITARVEAIQTLMDERGWSALRLAAELECSPNTVKALLAGAGVGGATVAGVLTVFPDAAFDDLFVVVKATEPEQVPA